MTLHSFVCNFSGDSWNSSVVALSCHLFWDVFSVIYWNLKWISENCLWNLSCFVSNISGISRNKRFKEGKFRDFGDILIRKLSHNFDKRLQMVKNSVRNSTRGFLIIFGVKVPALTLKFWSFLSFKNVFKPFLV